MIHHDPDNVSETPFDLTPMVDVVMLLIVFFTLTAQFAQSNLMPMDLPAVKGEANEETKLAPITIDLSVDGSLRLHSENMPLDRLAQLVAADLRNSPDAEVLVRADRNTPAKHLNELAATLSIVGAKRWRLATEGGDAS
jgi:biopolymer transport protein ExbD